MNWQISQFKKQTAFSLSIFAFSQIFVVAGSQAAPAKSSSAKNSAKPAIKALPASTKPVSTAPAKTTVSPALAQAYKSYVGNLQPKIGKAWNYPNGKNHVVLSVMIASDGSASELNLSSTPKNTEAEQAANDAFNQSQPLPALPSDSPPCRITITFDSSADPHGDAKANFYIKLDVLPKTAPAQTGDSLTTPADAPPASSTPDPSSNSNPPTESNPANTPAETTPPPTEQNTGEQKNPEQ